MGTCPWWSPPEQLSWHERCHCSVRASLISAPPLPRCPYPGGVLQDDSTSVVPNGGDEAPRVCQRRAGFPRTRHCEAPPAPCGVWSLWSGGCPRSLCPWHSPSKWDRVSVVGSGVGRKWCQGGQDAAGASVIDSSFCSSCALRASPQLPLQALGVCPSAFSPFSSFSLQLLQD